MKPNKEICAGNFLSILLVRAVAVFFMLGGIFPAQASPYAEGPLLGVVTDMPEGTWKKVNLNSFSEAWTPPELRPLKGSGNPPPDKIILAWSSFAWDSNRGDLLLYGGGHANYTGNDVYRWRSRSLKWERASLPSEIAPSLMTTIDGADAAPVSAHTYDNAVFLPIIDRYLNFGGAIYPDGGAYRRPSENDPALLRSTGPYLFDPGKANPNKVGGATGSHVQRAGQFPGIEGGEMWENRDLPKYLPDQYSLRGHINGCTAYSPESDQYDVVYVASRRGGGTGLALHRYQITDIHNPALDQYEIVGIFWGSPSAQTSCGYDPVRKVFLKSGINTQPFQFWDLRPERTTNRDQKVVMTETGADFMSWIQSYTAATGIPLYNCGLDYDPKRENFLLWCGGQEVWRITPPQSLSVNGWQFNMEPLGQGESPPLNVGTGILGKWEYIPGFDVFIGLENAVNGNIWVYKPIGWIKPGGGGGGGGAGNLAPEISLISPVQSENVPLNNTVTIAANATDSDGLIDSVVFRVNGSIISTLTSGPYSVTWTASALGSYTITAEANDNSGATALSEAILLNVIPGEDNGGGGGENITTVILQRSENNPNDANDTYLSTYHRTRNFGSSQRLPFYLQNYVPLIRFNIFASEGGPVPDGAVIESAVLSVYKELYNHVIALHAMLVPWKENEATWNQASNGLSWHIAGAGAAGLDYQSIPDAIANAAWTQGWVDFDVTDRLGIIASNAAENYGWRFMSVSGNNNLKNFYTSEKLPELDLHPKLEIRWR
ncbi:MAG: hypothetical protein RI993_936 [Pseudomonadota bacterium]|jgi:hypothetical protein